MEIQKIFSDMYDDERLYSVLLTEDEMDLYQAIFSEMEEEIEEPKKGSKAAKALGIAGGATLAGGLAADAVTMRNINKVIKKSGYKGFGDFIKNGSKDPEKLKKAQRLTNVLKKSKKQKALAAAALTGEVAGAGLLIGAGIKAKKNKKNK